MRGTSPKRDCDVYSGHIKQSSHTHTTPPPPSPRNSQPIHPRRPTLPPKRDPINQAIPPAHVSIMRGTRTRLRQVRCAACGTSPQMRAGPKGVCSRRRTRPHTAATGASSSLRPAEQDAATHSDTQKQIAARRARGHGRYDQIYPAAILAVNSGPACVCLPHINRESSDWSRPVGLTPVDSWQSASGSLSEPLRLVSGESWGWGEPCELASVIIPEGLRVLR